MTYKHPVELMLTGYTHEYCTYELDTTEVNTLINHVTTLAVKVKAERLIHVLTR